MVLEDECVREGVLREDQEASRQDEVDRPQQMRQTEHEREVEAASVTATHAYRGLQPTTYSSVQKSVFGAVQNDQKQRSKKHVQRERREQIITKGALSPNEINLGRLFLAMARNEETSLWSGCLLDQVDRERIFGVCGSGRLRRPAAKTRGTISRQTMPT